MTYSVMSPSYKTPNWYLPIGSGRALILKNYYIMCIITQIVLPITPKFVFVLTKFGQHKHKFFTVINNSALYKKMFRHE